MMLHFARLAPLSASAARSLARLSEAVAAIAILGVFTVAAVQFIAPIPAPIRPYALAQNAPSSSYPSDLSISSHPFAARAGAPAPPDATQLEESALSLVLHGTWRGGGVMAAVISADGAAQKKFMAGDEIVAGVRLDDVQDEYVIIDNQGRRETVAIVNRKVDPVSAAVRAADDGARSLPRADAPPSKSLRDSSLQQTSFIATLAAKDFDTDQLTETPDAVIPNATE